MNAEQLSQEIIQLVYHQAVVSDDPYVQEVAVQTSIQDLLEEFEDDAARRSEYPDLKADVGDLTTELAEANRKIADLEEEKGRLQDKLEAAYASVEFPD